MRERERERALLGTVQRDAERLVIIHTQTLSLSLSLTHTHTQVQRQLAQRDAERRELGER